jgi:processive 1,2-diacylglycerol beta-glucosyltransferase
MGSNPRLPRQIFNAFMLTAFAASIGFSFYARGADNDTPKPVVQFFTIKAGAGHENIEKAIQDGLPGSALTQHATIVGQSIIINKYLTPRGDFLLRRSYELMAEHFPLLWNFSYSVLPKILPAETQRKMYRGLITPQLTAQLQKNNPRLIFCTQTMLPLFVDIMKEDGTLPSNTKVVSFVTDYSVNESYNVPGLIIVPHQSLKDQLVKLGKDPGLVKVVDGIPAGLRFRDPYNKEEERKKLAEQILKETGIDIGTKDPLFVATGGGQALEMSKMIDFLPNWHPTRPIKVVLNFGEKDALKGKAEALIASGKLDPKITFVTTGWVDNGPYFKAADAVIGKPGGSVTAEMIALQKALFSQSYVAGQEEKNFTFLTKLGVIQNIKGKMETLNDVDAVIALAKRSEQAIKIHYPTATEIPSQVLKITDDYLTGKIPESSSEQAKLDNRIHLRDKKNKVLAPHDEDSKFEKWDNPNTEIIYLRDPQVDFAVRKTLIGRATQSIDVASFGQASDQHGIGLIQSLRTASNEGIQVRSVYERYGSRLEGDTTKHTQELLADSQLKCPAGVVCGTSVKRLLKGISPDDFFHMKFVIIDRGLPTMTIVGFGGRNTGKLADDFGDAAFVLRPIDPTKPWAGEDLEKLFEQQYGLMKSVHGEVRPKKPSKEALGKLENAPDNSLSTVEQKEAYKKIMGIIDSAPKPNGQLDEMVFHPKKMQLFTNSALKNAIQKKLTYTVDQRANLPNNVLANLHEVLPLADEVIVSSYAFNAPEPVRTDLMNLVKRGRSLTVMTNSREAAEAMTPPKTVARALGISSTDMTLRNLVPIAKAAKISGANLKLALLDPVEAAKHPSGYKYLHRKLITIKMKGKEIVIEEDDNGNLVVNQPENRSVLGGSDNMTKSSARKNTEVVWGMEDERLANHLESQIKTEISTFYKSYGPDEIIQKASEIPLYKCIGGGLVRRLHEWAVDQFF